MLPATTVAVVVADDSSLPTTQKRILQLEQQKQSKLLSSWTLIPRKSLNKEQKLRMHIVNEKDRIDGLRNLLRFYNNNNVGIAENDVSLFHPVVVFPRIISHDNNNNNNESSQQLVPYYRLLDLRNSNTTASSTKPCFSTTTTIPWTTTPTVEEVSRFWTTAAANNNKNPIFLDFYGVGKYNEIRSDLYTTEMFEDDTHTIMGYTGSDRIVHVGIDLFGPVNTPVHAFADGTLLHAGYNPAQGDYGNVLVIEHPIRRRNEEKESDDVVAVLYALYGHLNKESIQNKTPGQPIQKGEIVGGMGDITENGGWTGIHVHFQLSIEKPITHDMPGVVSMNDREQALRDYPDPRIVLGMLYVG